MRISTLHMFKQSAESMSKRVGDNNSVYMRLSAGKNLLKASDDPKAATDAVKYQDALAKLELYSDARSSARGALQHEDNTLSGVGNLLTTSLTEKIVAAKSDTYSPDDRKALGAEIKGIRANLLDLANSRDGNGRYIFSGFHTDTPAFSEDGTFMGATEVRKQVVADGTEMPVSHLGDEVFGDIFKILDKAVAELEKGESDDLQEALSEASKAVTAGIERLGKAQAELGTNLQQLDALDMSGDTQINDMIVKIQTAIGSDYGTKTSLIMDSKMSEYALNASMMVFQSMQKMNLYNQF